MTAQSDIVAFERARVLRAVERIDEETKEITQAIEQLARALGADPAADDHQDKGGA